MKVAIVLFDWFPMGGLQRDCRRIGESLAGRGAEIDVICMSWQGEVPAQFNRIMPALEGTGKVARRKTFARFLARHLAQENYAAVIGFNRLPGLDYYFAADTCFAWKATRERNWLYRLAPRSRQYLAFEKAVFGSDASTTIFMLSPLQKKEYLACYPDAEQRIIDVPPGIDRNRRAGEDALELRKSLRAELNIGDDEILILQAGSGFRNKGVKRSLSAIASLPENIRNRTRLIIMGRDDPGRYAAMAKELNIAPAVTFMENRDDLARFYQGADLLLHPSFKESAGMVILEAVVAGLPVLTTATCGYAFHVEKAGAGRVIAEPFSQQTMNRMLLEMLQADRLEWRENGLRYGNTGDLYDMPDRVAGLVMENFREQNNAG